MIDRIWTLMHSCPTTAGVTPLDRMFIGMTVAFAVGIVRPRLGFAVLFLYMLFDAYRGCWLVSP